MNKKIVRAVAIALSGLQLTGCLTQAGLKQSVYSLSRGDFSSISGVNEHSPDYHKGPLSGAPRAQAEVAASLQRATSSGVVGYSQPEFKRRMEAFRDAKSAYMAAGPQVTQDQFVALSSTLRDVLVYADLVESGTPRVQKFAPKTPQVSSAYSIPAGATAEFSFNGFCVRPSLRKPSPGESMQLVPDDQMWSDYLPQYRNLMASKPDLAPVDYSRSRGASAYPAAMPDYQVAVWAMRGIGEGGVMPPQLANSLSPTHKQMLVNAGVPKTSIEASVVASGLYQQGAATLLQAAGSAITSAAGGAAPALRDGMRMAGAAGLTPDEMLVNPQILNSPRALGQSLDQWVMADEPPVPAASVADLDQYSVIAPAVTARTVSSGKLSGSFRITNLSDQSFSFNPDRYIANSRSMASQPAALARTGLTGMGPAYTVQKGGSGLPAGLMDDLLDLANDKLLDSLTGDKAFLADIGGLFKSKAVQNVLSSIPVVGNVLSLGTLIAGVNLDGTPMDSLDYAQAAIGILPVVGNLGRLGVVGGRATAGFVAAVNSRGGEITRDAIEVGLEVAGKESFAEVPAWMSDRFASVSDEIAQDFRG